MRTEKKLKEVPQGVLKTYYFMPNKRLFLHVFAHVFGEKHL